MTRKLAFMLAVSVTFGAVPQNAHALCSGGACNSFSVEGKNYSTSEKRVKVVVINKDKSRGIQLKGCVMQARKCTRTFVFEIDPGMKLQVSEPAATQGAILDMNAATFLPQQGSGPNVASQQCQRGCTGNDKPTEQARCLKNCPQATASPPSRTEALKIPGASLERISFDKLDGWTRDDHSNAFSTFQASCRPIVRSTSSNDMRPVHAALMAVCARALKAGPLNTEASRQFFEANFLPIRIRNLGDAAGLLTGYYEPIVEGSRFPTGEFTVPLYRRPPDLVADGASEPGGPFPNTGRAFRRTLSGELVPYYDRGEIEDGALDGQHLEICWLRKCRRALYSSRSRVRHGSGSRTAPCCASTTTRITVIPCTDWSRAD